MTTVAIHQPHYLPWTGLLDKWDRADLFILLDDAQFTRGGWHNRNYVHTHQGRHLLSVPILHDGLQPLNEVRIDYLQPWERTHIRTLGQSYARAPYVALLPYFTAAVYGCRWESLGELGVQSTLTLGQLFNIEKPTVLASNLGVSGRQSQRLADLCAAVGADTYLAGDGCAVYLDHQPFERAGISVRRQNFTHPIWPQPGLSEGEFVSHLTALDLLLNTGPQALEILRSTRHNSGVLR